VDRPPWPVRHVPRIESPPATALSRSPAVTVSADDLALLDLTFDPRDGPAVPDKPLDVPVFLSDVVELKSVGATEAAVRAS
jgi:hypothetical protein